MNPLKSDIDILPIGPGVTHPDLLPGLFAVLLDTSKGEGQIYNLACPIDSVSPAESGVA